MAVDYDAPKVRPEDDDTDSLDDLKAQASAKTSPTADVDEANLLEDLELPGADLSHETLDVAVVPTQGDEFVCRQCFMVNHVSRRAEPGADVCVDCG